jgi:uncharacterized membrane protein YdjX (TVP38/TMEM64 family)
MMVSLLALVRLLPTDRLVQTLHGYASELGPWAPVGFVLAFIGLTIVCLPGMPLNVLAGVVFGPWIGGALTVLASNASAALSFLISRYLAHDRTARFIQSHPRLDAVYRSLGGREGWKVVAAVRLSHALPFGLQNFLLGLTPIRFRHYLLATTLVTLPGIFLMAYFGYVGAIALTSSPDDPVSSVQWMRRAAGLVVAGVAVIYLGSLVRQHLSKRLQDRATRRGKTAEPAPRSGVVLTSVLLLTAVLSIALAVGCHVLM